MTEPQNEDTTDVHISRLVYSRDDLLSLRYVLPAPESLLSHLQRLDIFIPLDLLASPSAGKQLSTFNTDYQHARDLLLASLKTDTSVTKDRSHNSLKAEACIAKDVRHTSPKTDAHSTQDYLYTSLKTDAHSTQDYPYTSLKTDTHSTQVYTYILLKTDTHSTQDYPFTSLKTDARPSEDCPHSSLAFDPRHVQDWSDSSLKTDAPPSQDGPYPSLKTDALPSQDGPYPSIKTDAPTSQNGPYPSLTFHPHPVQDWPYPWVTTDAQEDHQHSTARVSTSAPGQASSMEDLSSSEDSFESCREYVEGSDPHSDPYALEERGDEFHDDSQAAETAGDAATAAVVPSACRARAGWPERIECICESLKRILHDGCRAKREMEESGRDPFQTLTEHFGFIRTALVALQGQHRTSSPYECPRHGVMPHQVTQSTCSFCAGSNVSRAADSAGCGELLGGEGGVPYVEFGSPADAGVGGGPGPYVGFGSAADVGLGGVPLVNFGSVADVRLGGVRGPYVGFGSAYDFGFGSAYDVGLSGVPYVRFASVADVGFGSVPYVGFGGTADFGSGDSVDVSLGGGADVRLDEGGDVGLVESGEAGQFGVDADVCLGDNRVVALGGGAYVGFDDGGDAGVAGDADVGFGHSGGVGADVGFGDRRDVGVGRDTGVGGCADVQFGERHDVGVGGCVNVGFGGAGDVGVDSSTDVGFGDWDDVGVGSDVGVGDCADVRFGDRGDVGVVSRTDVGSGDCDDVGVGSDVGVGGVADGVSGEGPCTAGGLSAVEKARRKVLTKASKKLVKVQRGLVTAVEDTERQRKGLQAQMELMDSNVEETEKSLRDHVTQLHHLLDHHHQHQQELLRQRHKDFLHQVLVTVMEGQNFEARLLDLQERVGERLNRIFKHRDVVAADADDVRALCEAFRSLTESKPTLQAQTVTYTVEVPQVTADDLQSLMGRFVITEERQPPHPEPAPDPAPVWSDSGTTPVHPAPEPAMPASGACTAKRSGPDTQASVPSGRSASEKPTETRKASKGEAPEGAGIPEWTAPKWPSGSPSLGAKGKLSETMTSTTSLASSAGSASTGTKKKKKKKKKAGASTVPAHPAPSPAETAGGGAAAPKGSGTCTWATVAAAGLSAPKGAPPAKARTASSANSAGGVPPKWVAPKWPPSTSGSLGAKEKLSETMASTTSIASSTCSSSASSKRRTKSRSRKKNKVAAAASAASPTPVAITLPSEAAAPKRIAGRGKQASGFAPRPDGEVWLVYGNRDPHLDLLNEKGDVLESTRIGGNAMGAASFSEEHVLVSFHSPRCQLMLLDSRKEARETFKLPLISTGLGVGSTGIAVSGYTSLYWIPLDGSPNEWIVKEKGSTLRHVCSCDVVILHGKEIVCAADKGGHEVCFYEKLESGGFSPLPPFSPGVASEKGQAAGAGSFTPLCVSAHHAGFLAVLDACSRSVVVLDVERNEAVSVLPWERLCEGEPAVIAFTLTAYDEAPKMWISTTSGELYLASLALCYCEL